MTGQEMTPQDQVVEWIEREIGPVRWIARQGRWRPAWFIEVEKDGEIVELYVRGGRGARFPPLPLSYEAKVQAAFAEAGVKVPAIHGFIDEIPALVMERLRGRPNIATAESDEDRERLRRDLANQMRLIHDIDPLKIAALGAPNPGDPHEQTLSIYHATEKLYLEGNRLPSPDIEFIRTWIERNTLPCDEGPAVITVDAGQFMFEDDEITGMVDLELVCIGDRHMDMAALRFRDRIEEIGDLESFFDLYHQQGGIELDRERIAFQEVVFRIIVPLQIAHELADPESINHHEYLSWHAGAIDDALKDIARISAIELEPYTLPDPVPERSSRLLQTLLPAVEAMPAPDDYIDYRRFDLSLAIRYLEDYATRRAAMEQEYLDELEVLTGKRPSDSWEGDLQLESFVREAGPELDEKILQILYSRNERVHQILRKHYIRYRPGKESE